MKKLISCKYHEDSQTVELLYMDGTLIDTDCVAVEDEVARNMYERSELDYLPYNDPIGYADLCRTAMWRIICEESRITGRWTKEDDRYAGCCKCCSIPTNCRY